LLRLNDALVAALFVFTTIGILFFLHDWEVASLPPFQRLYNGTENHFSWGSWEIVSINRIGTMGIAISQSEYQYLT